MKKILIMGLPGAGKTTLAKVLCNALKSVGSVIWFNADAVRSFCDDWEFTPEARIRQATRMKSLAMTAPQDFVVCDFVAPTEQTRNVFNADFVIWVDTIKECRFSDTTNVFEPPSNYDVRITSHPTEIVVRDLCSKITDGGA